MELHIHIYAEPPPSKHMNNKKKKKCVHGIIILRLNDWMPFTFTCLGEERVYDNNNNIRGNVCSSLTPWNILQLLCSVHCVKRGVFLCEKVASLLSWWGEWRQWNFFGCCAVGKPLTRWGVAFPFQELRGCGLEKAFVWFSWWLVGQLNIDTILIWN